MKAEGIYAVVGMPYSGSTLLSFILGSNKHVYNGADLHHLNPDKKGVCSLHKDECDVLSAQALAKIYDSFGNCDEWYDEIADATGRSYIFDASKQLSFFKEVLPSTNKKVVVIALNKHPIRALASDIFNRLFDRKLKIRSLPEIRSYMENNKDEVKSFLKQRLKAIKDDVEEREKLLSKIDGKANIVKIRRIKYEDYISHPDDVCSELLSDYGLAYDRDFLNYAHYEHHPVTGNMAPIWKVRSHGKEHKGSDSNYRKSFYMNNASSIVIDDKFKELFSRDEIEWIEKQSEYNKLLSILGYNKFTKPNALNALKKYFKEMF